jgi:hypothetical protein
MDIGNIHLANSEFYGSRAFLYQGVGVMQEKNSTGWQMF